MHSTIPDTLPLLSAMCGINNSEGFVWFEPVNPVAVSIANIFRELAIHTDGERWVYTTDVFENIADAMESHGLQMLSCNWELN